METDPAAMMKLKKMMQKQGRLWRREVRRQQNPDSFSTIFQMQTTNSNTRIGIVTRRSGSGDESLIHVWPLHPINPTMEYKFPRWSTPIMFRSGQFVRFEPTHSIDDVQEDTKIWPENDSKFLDEISVFMPGLDPEFMIKTTILFPPFNAGQYHDELAETSGLGCFGIAWSWEFGRVALMDDVLAYKPGLFYSVYATRIHPNQDWIAAKMGTLWVICTDESPPKEVTDPTMLAEIRPKIPWKDYLGRTIGNLGVPNAATQLQNLIASSSRQQPIFSSLDDDWNSEFDINDKHRPPPQQRTNGGLDMVKPAADPEVATVLDEEAVLFGKLVALKLVWINARSANAANHLRKAILDLCDQYKSKMPADSADSGTHRQQQQQAPMSMDKDILFG